MSKARMSRRLPLAISATFFIATILLSSTVLTTLAVAEIYSSTVLPDFLEKLLVKKNPDANQSILGEIRTMWLKQIALNEERRESAELIIGQDSVTVTYRYMSQYLGTEEFPTGVGDVTYDTYIVGPVDDCFTRFLTPVLGSGASVYGRMSALATGYIYVMGKLGPTGAGKNGNYFTVFGNNVSDPLDPGWNVNFLGYGKVTQPYSNPHGSWVYIGFNSSKYSYVDVGAVAMGGICTYNDIMADCIQFRSP